MPTFHLHRLRFILGIFKPNVRRLEATPCLVSDSDEELLIKVFFVSPVHIRKIMVIGGGDEEQHPSHLKVRKWFSGLL